MPRARTCCVPGCNDTESTRHRFPVYEEEVYNTWISRIGNGKLKNLHPLEVYKSPYVVCGCHFAPECRIEGSKKLKHYSLPTLHLPGFVALAGTSSFLFPGVHHLNNAENTIGDICEGSVVCEFSQTSPEECIPMLREIPSLNVQFSRVENEVQPNVQHVDADLGVQPLCATPVKACKTLDSATTGAHEIKDESLTCNVCDRSFSTSKMLAHHQQKKRHFGCSACDSLFPSLMALEHHKEEFEHWSSDESLGDRSESGHEDSSDGTVTSEELERLL